MNAPLALADRPAILLVHGALGGAEQMQPLAAALRDAGTVQLVELPGHGATALADGVAFDLPSFARSIHDAARRHRIGNLAPICFGYSMGGYAALLLEATSPGTLSGIVTLGTKFEWSPDVATAAASRLDVSAIRAKVPAFAEQLRARHERAGGWELVLSRTAQLLIALGSEPLLSASRLATIAAPVRIAIGSRDDTVTAHEAERIASLLAHATVHILHDVPHPIERVPTHLVVDLVVDLLADVVRDLPRS